jgi:hypothetical protein
LAKPSHPLPRRIEELEEPETAAERALPIAGARVALVDYALVRRDFPALRPAALARRHPELAGLGRRRRTAAEHRLIDGWLVARAALVSERQAAGGEVNDPVPTQGRPVRGWRPPRYGRSLVVPAAPFTGHGGGRGRREGGLLEVKGAGVAPDAEPSLAPHSDGLMLLGEALADWAMERMIDAALRHAGSRYRAVPTYAVLDTGFDQRLPEGWSLPTGLQVRRANRRPLGGAELPPCGSEEERVKLEIELLLRHYGITSCGRGTTLALEQGDDGPYVSYGGIVEIEHWTPEEQLAAFHERAGADGPRRFEAVNVQLTREVETHPRHARLVDFGHYELRRRFELPLISTVSDRVLRWGAELRPESPWWVQPLDELTLPEASWGPPTEAEIEAAGDLPRFAHVGRLHLLAFTLARRLRAGEVSAAEVRRRLAAPVRAAVGKWRGDY